MSQILRFTAAVCFSLVLLVGTRLAKAGPIAPTGAMPNLKSTTASPITLETFLAQTAASASVTEADFFVMTEDVSENNASMPRSSTDDLRFNYGPPPEGASTPEPSTGVFVLFGALVLWLSILRHRRV